MKYFLYLFLIGILFSCDSFKSEKSKELVLSYGSQDLLFEDVIANYPKGINKKDSISWFDNYKRQWLKNQIIIQKVEKELPSSELNIGLELLQYKSDLLKFKFQNYYIKNKINTQVSLEEINSFYSNNKAALRVINVLVKASYIEVSNNVKDRYKVKKWLPSKNERIQEKLKMYCLKNAVVFDDFEGEWIELNILKRLSDLKEFNKNKLDLNKVLYTVNDSTTKYFLIYEAMYKGSVMPLEYAQETIVRLIINNRKAQIIEELNRLIEQAVEAEYK